jgi:uncharacterized protein YegP (UPF0339 family)
MPGKFVVRKSGKGFHWNLLASNGKVIASSDPYETRRAALAGIESVRKNAPKAVVVDGEDIPPRTEAAKLLAKRVGETVAKSFSPGNSLVQPPR